VNESRGLDAIMNLYMKAGIKTDFIAALPFPRIPSKEIAEDLSSDLRSRLSKRIVRFE